MSSKILDGNVVSSSVQEDLRQEIKGLSSAPGLAVILVGDNPASQVYVNRKKKVCESIGIRSFEFLVDANDEQSVLESVIDSCNDNDEIHGILLQLPLPKHMDEQCLLERIHPDKDVDGFHPMNVSKLLLGLDTYRSCTPYGVMEILSYYDINPKGKHVVIVGRSNIVGKPLAALMMQKAEGANATVTVCHSGTKNLSDICRSADILVAAIGIPEFIKADMVQPGAIVIDVGINRVDKPSSSGSTLVGDVDFESVEPKSTAITPVPGGVGPMTIAMLMKNTLKAYYKKHPNNT